MRRLILLVLIGVHSGCADPCVSTYQHGDEATIELGTMRFKRKAFTDGICGPAFVRVEALKNDGPIELVVSNFHKQAGFTVPDR